MKTLNYLWPESPRLASLLRFAAVAALGVPGCQVGAVDSASSSTARVPIDRTEVTAASARAAALLAALPVENSREARFPGIRLGDFSYSPGFQKIVSAAIALQALPHPDAEAVLRQWVQTLPPTSDARTLYFLGNLLFDRDDPERGFPWFTEIYAWSVLRKEDTATLGGTTLADWKHRPIAEVDGVQFAIWDIKEPWRRPQTYEPTLTACLDQFFAKGHWTSRVYPVITEERFVAALLKLESSPVFREPLKGFEKAALRDQFEVPPMPSPLPALANAPPLPQDLSFTVTISHRAYASRGTVPNHSTTTFNPEAYLEAAAALQAMPRDLALARLRAWALEDDEPKNPPPGLPTRFASRILCMMLFEPRPGGALVVRPFTWLLSDRPDGLGELTQDDLEQMPSVSGVVPTGMIALADGIPFLAAGYTLPIGIAGMWDPHQSIEFFDYCRRYGQWTARQYRPATRAELEAALRKVQAWYAGGESTFPKHPGLGPLPDSAGAARNFFAAQIGR